MKRSFSRGIGLLVALALLSGSAALARAEDATAKVLEYYRRKANVPPSIQLEVRDVKDSPIKGAKSGVLAAGNRKVPFTMSEDGRYVVFGEMEDLSVDPFAAVMKKINLQDRPFKGPADAKVTIVEYSDYQCPFCARGYKTIEDQVLKEYGDKVKFYYKNFPLPMHPWAEPAAVATECALQQGDTDAYWKLYKFYFENQRDLKPDNLKDKTLEQLKDTKVDTAKFTECFDGKKTADLVKAEMTEGSSVGVTGTPAFVINGRLVSGAQPFENFKAVIDDELARASAK